MVEMKHNMSLAQEKILDLAKQYGEEKIAPKHLIEKSKDAQEEQKLREELRHLSEQFNAEMRRLGTNVSFNYDDTIEGLLVVVKDAQNERVIREIPSKEAIELMKKMHDLVGAIFDKRG
ncbi:flagellar protein FlaG [Helicobacter pametensis]|uniref:flagellar protein FlaG n=1 Tax=Helicobacter pametensis TaxID=95149 RepID=UPI0004AD1049|nr:flagellar protein FlaG [Helicobacter pametensis]